MVVKIGPSEWDLEFVESIPGGNTAETEYWEGAILITRDAPKGRLLPLLLHEVLEAFNFQYGDALDLTHPQICILGEALSQFILDNLELLQAFASGDVLEESRAP